MNKYTIDILCFYGLDSRSFVIKELSIVNNWTLAADSFIFAPPYDSDVQRTNIWLEENLHGIKWSDGDVPYSSLSSILTKYIDRCEAVFVKGKDKFKTIKQLLPTSNLIDLESL
jgi:hypothetical protein